MSTYELELGQRGRIVSWGYCYDYGDRTSLHVDGQLRSVITADGNNGYDCLEKLQAFFGEIGDIPFSVRVSREKILIGRLCWTAGMIKANPEACIERILFVLAKRSVVKKPRHFVVVGRIPEEDNIVFTCKANSRRHAVAKFKTHLFRGYSKAAKADLADANGQVCYIDAVCESKTPIRVSLTKGASD